MRKNSETIFLNSCGVIPGGVNSPVRSFQSVGSMPMIVDSGSKDLIVDVDGHQLIDFCMSWGALILGHAHPLIVRCAQEAISRGTTFGIATEIEYRLAAKICSHYPSIEKVRFVSTGTESTMTALRIARAATKRSKIIKFSGHYHGHHDSLLVQAGSGAYFLNSEATSLGVSPNIIEDTLCFTFNDFDVLSHFFETDPRASQIAAVIVEPVAANMGVVLPKPHYLDHLRTLTEKNGTLLIFDEVVTGFRVGLSGAQGLFNIIPDLTCFGKIIGGGFPAAAVGGKEKYMNLLAPLGQVYQAGTLSGNPIAMNAGLKTIEILEDPLFYERLNLKTEKFLEPILNCIQTFNANLCIQRQGSMFTIFFGVQKLENHLDTQKIDRKKFSEFFRFLLDRGIYFPPAPLEACFISDAHTEDHLEYTADVICSFLRDCNTNPNK